MKLYHAVASECGDDGTQLVDLGVFESQTAAKKHIRNILKSEEDTYMMNISYRNLSCYMTDNSGNITYEWVADIFPVEFDLTIHKNKQKKEDDE